MLGNYYDVPRFYARWNGLWWRPAWCTVYTAAPMFLCPLEWAVVET